MFRKQIVATNNVDRQNEMIANEVLFEFAESINTHVSVVDLSVL